MRYYAWFGSDYHTAPGSVSPGTSAQRLLTGGPAAVAVAPAEFRNRSSVQVARIGVINEGTDQAPAETARTLADALGASVVEASNGSADLLVIGSRPEATQGQLTLSAVAEYALDIATCPVLALPRGVPLRFEARTLSSALIAGQPATDATRQPAARSRSASSCSECARSPTRSSGARCSTPGGTGAYPACAAGMVRRFIRTLSPGDTSCAERVPEIHVVREFPRRTASAPEATSVSRGDRSSPTRRRAAWVAGLTVGDALARWWLMSGSKGHGLRGGSFTAFGDYLAYTPVRLRMGGVRLASDLATSGVVTWDRRRSRVSGRLRLSGVVRGRVAIRWRLDQEHAVARMAGTLGDRPVRLRMPAP